MGFSSLSSSSGFHNFYKTSKRAEERENEAGANAAKYSNSRNRGKYYKTGIVIDKGWIIDISQRQFEREWHFATT